VTSIDARRPAERPTTGFRPGSRRRARIAAGVALGAIAVAGNVLVYGSLDDRTAVLQVVRDVPAGAQLSHDDLRAVDVGVDGSVRTIDATALDTVVGSYAKVRLVAGSLVVDSALQLLPLLGADAAVVAVQLPEGELPVGLRERSQVQLVLRGGGSAIEPAGVVTGRVVGLPTAASGTTGSVSLSVEVPVVDAARVAASDDVRVVLLPPGDDVASASAVSEPGT
jgi:hypothetical protein